MNKVKPLVLLILDGWGCTTDSNYNAISQAKTPQWDNWLQKYPHCLLDACGESVGLPEHQIGNSEVGHMHIGAGRVLLQDFSRINQDINTGRFIHQPVLKQLCEDTLGKNATLHVMGLLSAGGIHAHQNHLFEFLRLANLNGQPRIAIHLFLDGRDTPPRSALDCIASLSTLLKNYPFAKIVSLCGRFYAMDRDKRWERLQQTYDLLTLGNKPIFPDAKTAIEHYYAEGLNDEFIPASVIGQHATTIHDHDNVFFFNFRSDRAIQITDSLINQNFDGFKRTPPIIDHFVSMVPYAQYLPTQAVYPEHNISQTIGEIMEKHHLNQLRIAETEKFPHVTYFLNGGREQPFEGESRILIPSPKVKTYDLMPQMRADEITDAIIQGLSSGQYPLIIANFANADMVGHCGELPAAITAIEALDRCFTKINEALIKFDAQAIITADHGNAEIMFDESTGQKHTAHTLSLVPFLFIGKNWQVTKTHGSLIDIAPTILELMGLTKPSEMTGNCLLKKD
jgi:2,3-bisphosphoglycerate-independent phosphoglycerate mutase